MILLLGGTADTEPVARALLGLGRSVLVSTVTDYPLTLSSHPGIQRRFGALHSVSLGELIREHGIVAIVDATHPYAEIIGPLSRRVAGEQGIPYFRFLRPKTEVTGEAVFYAKDHLEAARMVCAFERSVLLTVGTKNIDVYVEAAQRTKTPLYARVLDRQDSIDTCLSSGLPSEAIISGKGPFTTLHNIELIQRFNIGVLVTKDGGVAGGMKEKLEAARKTDCRLVIVDRPRTKEVYVYSDIDSMMSALKKLPLSARTTTPT